MKKLFKICSLLFVCLGFVVVAHTTQAALVTCGNSDSGPSGTVPADKCQFEDFVNTAIALVNYMLSGAAVVATGGLVYGGFLMITSAGNAARLASGKKALFNSVVGLAIILLSFLMVRTLFAALGYKKGDQLLTKPGEFLKDPGTDLNIPITN